MKVLAISASPRNKGNSDVLCNQFLKGAFETGHQTEKINLSQKNISPCIACYSCRKNHICFKKDDMEEIQQKIINSDVIILATPVYFYSMSAQMKIMIDRCLPHFKEIQNKDFYYIITAADPEHSAADEAIAGFRGYLRCLPGAKEQGIIYGTGTWDKDDVFRHPSINEAYEMGRQI